MTVQRRQFLQSFSSLGAVGAATLALAACGQRPAPGTGVAAPAAAATPNGFLVSKGGRGPALEGPYLDLRTGRGNQLAYARLQGDLDWGKQKYFWFKGYIMGIEPHKQIRNLVGAQGFGVIRLNPREDGSIERLCREVILYTDLRSGEVIEEWDNPYTNERVPVVHVSNDPFNYLIEDHFPAPPTFGGLDTSAPPPRAPFVLPWHQHGPQLAMEMHIHLAYPNALQPDRWPRESSGPIVQASEFFAHHVKAEDMQNEALTTLDFTGVWNRITPWLPWMLMGQTPGNCQYACFMGTATDLETVLSRNLLDYVEKNIDPKYFHAPEEWTGEPSLSSFEHYAEQQTPAPVRE
ncbi:MAG: DUF1838 family protein [Gammaproteobacteria bacterium]|nr:DUF1838 family protein [Gammaproteobacteria bacterium]